MTELEIKYIGWNMGQYGKERHETKSSIELLELKIDGVDVLKQIEAVKKWEDKWGHHITNPIMHEKLWKILGLTE